ncbi:MAG: Uma2 family endonuclease [Acidobacteriota bacterium]
MLTQSAEPRFTYGDYRRWHGDDRWELIDGIAFDMSPAPSRVHQDVTFGVARQLADALDEGPCRVYVATFDVRLPEGDEADDEITTVVQPDVSVVCDSEKLDRSGCRGGPDFILEVGSPRTSARDHHQKRDLYERHGVKEYWIVDPDRRTLVIHRLDPATGHFAPPVTGAARGTTGLGLFDGLTIRWRRIFR